MPSVARQNIASWMLVACGAWLVGLGFYFIVLRPPLLPEDVRFTGTTIDHLRSSLPGLERWLSKVFTVMGGLYGRCWSPDGVPSPHSDSIQGEGHRTRCGVNRRFDRSPHERSKLRPAVRLQVDLARAAAFVVFGVAQLHEWLEIMTGGGLLTARTARRRGAQGRKQALLPSGGTVLPCGVS